MSLEAFKTRVLPVKNKLFRFAYRLVNSEEEAKDIVQDVMIKVWNNRENMDQTRNMEAWCMTLTRNLSLDRLKSKHLGHQEIETQYDLANPLATPYRSTEMSDTMHRVNELIEGLPSKQKQIIILRDVEGMTYKEISKVLEIDINQVKVNLFRARRSVRENLTEINSYGLS